jgi:hypothetical protein
MRDLYLVSIPDPGGSPQTWEFLQEGGVLDPVRTTDPGGLPQTWEIL